jgi:hypothetical protein
MEQNAGSNGESELEPQRCVLKVGGGLLISFALRGWRVLFKYFRLNCSAWKKVDVTMVYCGVNDEPSKNVFLFEITLLTWKEPPLLKWRFSKLRDLIVEQKD